MLRQLGDTAAAIPLFREELAGCRTTLGDDHEDTLGSINNLADLLQDEGRLDEAQPLLEEALAGRRAALGDAHPDTLGSINNLGALLKTQG